MRVRVKTRPATKILSFEDILSNLNLPQTDADRLTSYMQEERRERAAYQQRRYLRHLTEDELHLRIGYLIANVVYVSHRNRYSTNNLYSNYWRARLAHTAEELVVRGSVRPVASEVLRRLPNLGFPTPSPTSDDAQPVALYRYDKLRYLKRLREKGEVYLRCASTRDPTNDFARDDPNELCIQLRLLAEDLEMTVSSPSFAKKQWMKTVNFEIYQRTDFFMFCLSQVYDWRLFGDFDAGNQPAAPEDRIGCLVITDPRKFARRFAAAIEEFKRDHGPEFTHELRLSAQPAFYYDAADPEECAPLFEHRNILPFAKRREYTYQHEFRFIARPNIPDDFVPDCAPDKLPHFQRCHLHLGSLEDCSHVVEPNGQTPEAHPFYLATKNAVLLASAVGVTLPNSGRMVRFTYAFEAKEKGRMDAKNLTEPKRYSGGSMQGSEREIDVPADGNPAHMLHAIRHFYGVFDVREHGNHLIEFEACDPDLSWRCTYRAFLPCAEPADDKIVPNRLTFEFEYTCLDGEGRASSQEEVAEIEGHTYQAQYNGVGPLHLHATYRSLLIAEMEFFDRLMQRGVTRITALTVRNRDTNYRCSELKTH